MNIELVKIPVVTETDWVQLTLTMDEAKLLKLLCINIGGSSVASEPSKFVPLYLDLTRYPNEEIQRRVRTLIDKFSQGLYREGVGLPS